MTKKTTEIIALEFKNTVYCLVEETEKVKESYYREYEKWRNQWELARKTPEERKENKANFGEYEGLVKF